MKLERRVIESPIELTENQLGYLFSLLEIESFPGLKKTRFSPKTESVSDELWQQTIESLLKERWMIKDEAGNYEINPDLIRVLINMATSDFTVVSNLRSVLNKEFGIVHYFGKDFVVEMGNQAGSYELSLVESKDIALHRISNYLGFSLKASRTSEIVLTEEESELIKAGKSLDHENASTAKLLSDSLVNAQSKGNLTILEKTGGAGYKPTVLGFITSPIASWLISYENPDHISYQSLDSAGFIGSLMNRLKLT